MDKEITLMEPELPQLRQMVQKNSERIDKHEMTINRMLMENAEQSRKISECDEWAERSRIECERWMKNMRKTLDEIAQISEASEQSSRELKEMIKETDKQIKETDKQIKETSMEMKKLSRQLSGTTGHIVEGLVSSSVEKIFKEAGLELHNSGKNLKRKLKAENIAMEVDVLLSNETMAVPIEVKTNFTKEELYRFLHQMGLFRKLFPELADKRVVAAVAAVNYEREVAELAHKEGLLVIRVSSDDIFSLDPFDEKGLRQF